MKTIEVSHVDSVNEVSHELGDHVCVCVFVFKVGLGWMGMLLMSLDIISVYS